MFRSLLISLSLFTLCFANDQLLRELIEKDIDTDDDNFISKEELSAWYNKKRDQDVDKHTDIKFEDIDTDDDSDVEWAEFEAAMTAADAADTADEKARWEAADVDDDGALSREEFEAFLHPEDHEHMYEVLSKEYLDRFDADQDGIIERDAGEFKDPDQSSDPIFDKDMDGRMDDDEEADEILEEQDADDDGVVTKEEIISWLQTREDQEVEEIFKEADDDNDGRLSMAEMIDILNDGLDDDDDDDVDEPKTEL